MHTRQTFLALRVNAWGWCSRALYALHRKAGTWATRAAKARDRALCDEVNAARACRVITR